MPNPFWGQLFSRSVGTMANWAAIPMLRKLKWKEAAHERRDNSRLRLLMLLPIIITLLNSPLPTIDNPGGERVVFAATAEGAPQEAKTGPVLPKKQEILTLLKRANSWQMAHPVMKPDDRNWERATWYTGVMAAWKSTKDQLFLDQALAWGRQHEWQVGTEPAGANRLFCVETWTELYFVKKDRAMIEPAIKWLATPGPLSPAGSKQWYLDHKSRSLRGFPLRRIGTRHARQSHR